jgi:hypothetical protein
VSTSCTSDSGKRAPYRRGSVLSCPIWITKLMRIRFYIEPHVVSAVSSGILARKVRVAVDPYGSDYGPGLRGRLQPHLSQTDDLVISCEMHQPNTPPKFDETKPTMVCVQSQPRSAGPAPAAQQEDACIAIENWIAL